MHLSRNSPFSEKKNLHLELPGFWLQQYPPETSIPKYYFSVAVARFLFSKRMELWWGEWPNFINPISIVCVAVGMKFPPVRLFLFLVCLWSELFWTNWVVFRKPWRMHGTGVGGVGCLRVHLLRCLWRTRGAWMYRRTALTILFEIIARMKLLFSNYLGDYSYSFQGSSELISITVTVSFSFFYWRMELQEIIPLRNSQAFSAITVTWFNGFRIKAVMISKRMVCISTRIHIYIYIWL